MSREPWFMLGLNRTADLAEIRRAYARKLKTIDADADPQAFVALRAALEQAMAEARVLPAETAPNPQGETEPAPDFRPSEAGDAALSVRISVARAREDEDAPFRRLNALLFAPEPEAGPDPDMLATALREILDDPRMQQIDHAARVERWLAAELIDSVPRSDPILAMAVAHFDWESDNGRWDQPALLAQLTGRHKALLFLNHIAAPEHVLHDAYVELSREGDALELNRFLIGGHVRKLLEIIRSRCPEAEGWLNPVLVARWDERLRHSGPGLRTWLWLGWVLLILLFMVTGNIQRG